MDKNKDQAEQEKKIYSFWEKQGLFKADPNSEKEPYSLLMPPPNLTGSLHLGHAMQHAILDAIARYKRMQGFDVLLLPGVDHAGIQFEGTLDKLLAKENLSKQKLGREKWLERAWKFKEEVYASFHNTWTILGLSADWSREVFTLEPKVQDAVLKQFQAFWDQDLLYKGAYIVSWCPKCQTAIEDVEMEYEEREDTLYYLQYGPLVLATTRPETKFGDTAMAVNPNDKRYKDLIGKKFEIDTLSGKKTMKVIADDAIDPEFGTGAEKVTPGHDILDYEIGKRHNLPIIQVINKEGRLTDVAGKYSGMKTAEARKAMLPELKEKGILVKTEPYKHSVPVCERCKTVVEPIISEEWFVKMDLLAKKALDHIGEINFHPKNFQKILSDWLENIHDWCISRSLWWGHRIPVWYCSKCNPNHEVGRDKDMVISLEEPGKNCDTCKEKRWVQDDQVLDTWFSSGLWPMSTLDWPASPAKQGESEDTKELKRYFPWDFELTSPEIKYLWIARMIMLSLWHKDSIPFKNMFFHGMLRPLKGAKFSKSLGNAVYPDELIETWGVDATRMTLYTYSAPGRDARTSKQLMDERAKNYRNFGNKLANIGKFVIDLKPENSITKIDEENEDDRWILEELGKTVKEVTKNIDQFQLHLATDVIYEFIWHKFADVYIEKAKNRREDAQPCLEHVLDCSLRLLHPFMPFLTEELWLEKLKKEESIMTAPWPPPPEA